MEIAEAKDDDFNLCIFLIKLVLLEEGDSAFHVCS